MATEALKSILDEGFSFTKDGFSSPSSVTQTLLHTPSALAQLSAELDPSFPMSVPLPKFLLLPGISSPTEHNFRCVKMKMQHSTTYGIQLKRCLGGILQL